MNTDWIVPVVVALLSAVSVLIGQKFMSRSQERVSEAQTEIDQRKVDQEAFDRFVNRYEQERLKLAHQIEQMTGVLDSALKYIRRLRAAFPVENPPPPLPPELSRASIWYLDDYNNGGS